jgi:ABC-type dipeptide/oligopeptide/nickel transport system permease subunit
MRVGMLNPAAMVWPSIAIASVVAALSLITDGLRKELSRYQ